MKHISILVPENAILGSLEGSRQLFTQVNEFFKAKGAQPVFDVHLVGLTKETRLCGGLFTANPDLLIDQRSKDRSYHYSCIGRRYFQGDRKEQSFYSLDRKTI